MKRNVKTNTTTSNNEPNRESNRAARSQQAPDSMVPSHRSSRRGGPDISDDHATRPIPVNSRNTPRRQGTDEGIPELFPETSTRSGLSRGEKEQEKIKAYSKKSRKSARSMARDAAPEVVQDTVASKRRDREQEKIKSYTGGRKAAPGPCPSPGAAAPALTAKMSRRSKKAENSVSNLKPSVSRQVRKGSIGKGVKGSIASGSRGGSTLNTPEETIMSHEDGLETGEMSSQIVASAQTATTPHVVPGAVAIGGVGITDSDEEQDDLLVEDETAAVSSSPRARGLPEAQAVVDEDEEELFKDLEEGELVPESDLADEKEPGIKGWIKRHKRLTALLVLVVIGAAVGGAVGATVGGSGGPADPTMAPTIMPTASPTVSGFEILSPVLSSLTPRSVLVDTSTPQHAAMLWLLREDEFTTDFTSNNPRLLQRYALATIYFATNGRNWTSQLNFLSEQDECLWNESIGDTVFGVETCNEQGMITEMQLSRNGLEGTLPNEISALSSLTIFSAAINELVGVIPDSLYTLGSLNDIRLFQNQLEGTLSASFGSDLSRLTHLAIHENDLSGSLPESIGAAPELTTLSVGNNRFSGLLPPSIGNLTNLLNLFMENNQFSGNVPQEASNMVSLLVIALEENDFTGSMAPFCADGISFNSFRADCLSQVRPGAPDIIAEVECECCTTCCGINVNQQLCLLTVPSA